MDSLLKKTFKTAAGHEYTYWTAKAKDGKPTLLLLHGNPDSAALWTDLIINFLQPEGYSVIAPDLLGFGSSDKPEGVENYTMSSLSKDLLAILDNEGLKQVIPLGHDFGANLASKFAAFAPERVSGLVTLGTAYIPPSPYPFDFEQIRAMQEQYVGYCSIWYFPLFTSEEGYRVIDENVENMFTALHGGGERMKEVCCYEGAMEKWLREPSNVEKEVLPYAKDAQYRKEWIDRMEQNSFRAPLDWYKATSRSLDLQAESNALQAGNHIIKAPYLFVAALTDPLAPSAAVQGPIAQGTLPDVTLEEVDASHWCMHERPTEVGQAVVRWLSSKF
ncbi:hypothetical protein PRZ48_004917 [Zasmidium cellare]|uniref:AB hydrolase-1 domain-containing protein n=1 Tax=Zasmidium cellare TaxID=395010 RepID=A0ABR0EQW4_ZASCE|nr:hypothetical protein PRZ48_004917 [Zasmidium cellare]